MARLRSLAVAVAVAVVTALALPADAAPSPTGQANRERPVCGAPAANQARCHAHVRTKGDGAAPLATTGPTGFSASQLQTAYGLVTSVPAPGTGPTIAIVDAYAHPNAESDLNVYRSQMGLGSCTSASGCFTEINQNGGPRSAVADVGWGREEMLDLEMASAICPNCRLLYVGANSNTFADLGAAVNQAASPGRGVVVISNSYGANEFNGETAYESLYNHPGIAVTVSSGDSGYGAEFPASSRYVTAVGGTRLTLNANGTRNTETAWSGAGSGCSAYIAKPAWQRDTGCARRTVADVSAVADPATGVSVYDTYGSTGGNNWYVFGGTSVAAPIVAGVYALSGNTAAVPARLAWDNRTALFDVVSGTNGRCTRGKNTAGAYLCQAGPGYDGPTGNGAPNGAGSLSAF